MGSEMNLAEIGTVVRLQIQRKSLKVGEKPFRTYDPSPLLSVTRLNVTSQGAIALLPDGGEVIDVHHANHPESKYAGDNSLSIGFTLNYAQMRERFGDHLFDGCAGENVLIQTDRPINLNDLRRGLLLRCAADTFLRLDQISVAHPCVEFSRYSTQLPQAEKDSSTIKATLQFLEGGLRGYYTVPANDEPLMVSVDNQVYLPE
jgi:hypothetical protein